MHPTLQEIKKLRQQAGLTQHELAKKAGVSQSLIAKIEADMIDPTYGKATQILETLHNLHERKEKQAENFMNKHMISVGQEESLKKAIAKMKRYDISQLPVIERNVPVGTISEAIILEAFMRDDLQEPKVKHVMDDAPPVVPHDAKKKIIVELLALYAIVLVSKSGKLVGIITKSDLISKLY